MNVSDIAASAMLMPPEAEPVMPASTVTLMASLISGLGMALSASAITVKPGSSAITPPKPYSDAVFIDGQQGSGDRRLAAIGEPREHGPPGEHENRQYAEQQRAFHRPDRRHAGDLGDDGLGAERDLMRRPIGARNRCVRRKVRGAHHHQRRKSNPGVRQLLGLERLRLVEKLGAVALALRLRGAAAVSI